MTLHNYSCMPAPEAMAYLVDNDISFFYNRHLVRFCADEEIAAGLQAATGVDIVDDDAAPGYDE